MHEDRVSPLYKSPEYSFHDEIGSSGENSPLNENELKLTTTKALIQFRFIVEDAILKNYLFVSRRFYFRGGGNEEEEEEEEEGGEEGEKEKENDKNPSNLTLWGVPLLPSKGHPCTDIVLLKFLEARRYSVSDAFRLLRRTMAWRRNYRVDKIVDEKFSPELESMWCTSGVDKEGRPVCYHNMSAFKDKEFRNKFWRSNHKLQQEFIRWRVKCIENEIKMLDFNPGGTNSVIYIIDVQDAPKPAFNEIRWYFRKMLTMIYDNYPGVIHKTFIVNVPIWFFAAYAINLTKVMQRNREQVVFLRSSKVKKNLLKCITPDTLISRYGGLKRENDDVEFTSDDKVLELNVRANSVEYIQIPADQVETTITWDVTMVGSSDVIYKEEFVPSDDCSYRVLLKKEERMKRKNSIRNSFYIRETGFIVITILNSSFKNSVVFYRSKTKPFNFPLFSSSSSIPSSI